MRFLRILLTMLLLLTINPQLFYDMIQLEIRGVTIKYSSQKKKDANPQVAPNFLEIFTSFFGGT